MTSTDAQVPLVAVVVLNWNGNDDTMTCVESLAGLDYPRLEIIVVDNGSRVSPRVEIERRWPDVHVIENPRNLGYAGGNNAGIRHALDRGADFVWVLNNDAVVEPDTLAPLVECALEHPRAAAVGGRVFREDGKTLWMTWGEVTWLQSLIRLVGRDRLDEERYRTTRQVAWIPGCSILLRSETLREIGGFDEEFFAYHEDVEWATRARRAGWEIWYAGTSRLIHRGQGSSGGERASYLGFRSYLSARNTILYARRHGRLRQRVLLASAIVVTLPFQYVRRLLVGEQRGVRMKVRGWLDGLAGRPIPLAELGLEDRSAPR